MDRFELHATGGARSDCATNVELRTITSPRGKSSAPLGGGREGAYNHAKVQVLPIQWLIMACLHRAIFHHKKAIFIEIHRRKKRPHANIPLLIALCSADMYTFSSGTLEKMQKWVVTVFATRRRILAIRGFYYVVCQQYAAIVHL